MENVTISIKYFDKLDYKVKRLLHIEKGDWIDLYAAEDVYIPCIVGVPNAKATLIPLGVGMKLPEGYEAYIVPRSSTFKTWGIIQANHIGIVDNSYCGDNDQWMMAAICVSPRNGEGTYIKRGDKICQFRIQKKMPEVTFHEVNHLEEKDRGAFGSTGST